jgi:Poly (ADP-ribose) glycohydrolase (PARG)
LGDFRGDIGGDVLEPAGLGEEERIFLAHPEMIVARIFLEKPLKDDEALLVQNVKIFDEKILHGTFCEEIAKSNGQGSSSFALIQETSVLIASPSPLSFEVHHLYP